ncbi:CopL family metal-binding regulatory protein [Xanthomonas vesicatoria]|uniref:CopL family metal-binding regulatory protein n=1 Tax=Xanthomonas vesicatoria TaxID=56460 RepID=A0AAJ0N3H0_9XANT|nr:CopL family metal-binding regulatory protein [Xanthomonas vesicatoria]APO95194.1 copper homeostasis protein [Xanthomonas vesicatoria]KHM91471.1 copper homeostasis protein [Xanthomonas vesicatoria]KHM93326.1 copper homeostasis protein [Xanthomonas vesicatoria]KTF36740.1 copper homeostasis protein [Xanthomonas vesicatoria]MCC8559615.1 CopL family metal-binding regulatory protein [Xanthomonas vesicatoria]
MLRCLFRLLLCLCLVANTATGAWASVGMAMPHSVMPQTAPHTMQIHVTAAAMPCHDAMPAADAAPLPDKARHAHASDCCKLGSCDCLQHCSLALLTLPAVPAGLLGHSAVPAALDEGRSSPAHEQPVRPPIG